MSSMLFSLPDQQRSRMLAIPLRRGWMPGALQPPQGTLGLLLHQTQRPHPLQQMPVLLPLNRSQL